MLSIFQIQKILQVKMSSLERMRNFSKKLSKDFYVFRDLNKDVNKSFIL